MTPEMGLGGRRADRSYAAMKDKLRHVASVLGTWLRQYLDPRCSAALQHQMDGDREQRQRSAPSAMRWWLLFERHHRPLYLDRRKRQVGRANHALTWSYQPISRTDRLFDLGDAFAGAADFHSYSRR
jgi:hypothetical protein